MDARTTEQLTAATGAVLLVLLAALGITILSYVKQNSLSAVL